MVKKLNKSVKKSKETPKTEEKLKKSLYTSYEMKEKYKLYNVFKIGYLDIEATNLKANFGFMLSWAMEIRDTQTGKCKIVSACVTREDINRAYRERKISADKAIIEKLIKTLKDEKIDLLIGHYFNGWNKMDIPFIRTRCIMNKIKGWPKHRTIRYGDTWSMAHKLYSIHRYGLEAIGDMMGVKTKKTRVEGLEWQLAVQGDPKSLRYVLDHNIKDVKITKPVHMHMEEYSPIPSTYI